MIGLLLALAGLSVAKKVMSHYPELKDHERVGCNYIDYYVGANYPTGDVMSFDSLSEESKEAIRNTIRNAELGGDA